MDTTIKRVQLLLKAYLVVSYILLSLNPYIVLDAQEEDINSQEIPYYRDQMGEHHENVSVFYDHDEGIWKLLQVNNVEHPFGEIEDQIVSPCINSFLFSLLDGYGRKRGGLPWFHSYNAFTRKDWADWISAFKFYGGQERDLPDLIMGILQSPERTYLDSNREQCNDFQKGNRHEGLGSQKWVFGVK